jgi:hypothetical protein
VLLVAERLRADEERERLVREEIGARVERSKMWIVQVKHKKQMLDVRCQMQGFFTDI